MLLVENFFGEKERWWGRGDHVIQANDLSNKLGATFGLSLQWAGGEGVQMSKSTYSMPQSLIVPNLDETISSFGSVSGWSNLWKGPIVVKKYFSLFGE